MANTTNPSFAPTGDDDPGAANALTDWTAADSGGTPPFGDPDQHLYGGSGANWSVPSPSANAGDSSYEGRHRATE